MSLSCRSSAFKMTQRSRTLLRTSFDLVPLYLGSSFEVFYLMVAFLTQPSMDGCLSVISPLVHFPRIGLLSLTMTMSPTATLLSDFNRLALALRWGKQPADTLSKSC